MSLFNFKKKDDQIEHITAILLRQDEGVGYVCKVNTTKNEVEILDERSFRYSNGWENLIYDVDELLFNFENAHEIQIQKVTFFVYSHLVDQTSGDLKEPYMQAIKNVVAENKLDSLGYIELEESLAHTYSSLEQTPLTAVLVEIDSASVSAFVYQSGQKLFANTIAKTQNIVSDLEELFHRTEKGMLLPARILMYDSPTVESESHTILTHSWPDSLFVKPPRIDIVRDIEMKQSILEGVSRELFGMITPTITANPTPTPSSSGHEKIMGFAIGEDVRATSDVIDEVARDEPDEMESVDDSEAANLAPVASTSGRVLSTIRGMFSALKIPGGGSKKNIRIIVLCVALVMIIAGGIVSLLFFFHKASLTVLYKSEPIIDSLSFSNDAGLTEYKETFKVSAQIATTGKEDVGEKATGEVTLYNADETAKTFAKGTELTSSDGLVFVTDKEVTIEAATKKVNNDDTVVTSTSKVTVGATADDLGEKYNVKKDLKMSVGDFSDTTYYAKTATTFTGGSSKQIQTVSRADYTTIDKEIAAQLTKKSKEQLKTISAKGNIIEDLTLIDKKDQIYSKEISEEATSLTSQVTAHVSFYAYDDKKIKQAIAMKFQEDIPSNYVLSDKNITYTIASAVRGKTQKDIAIEVDATANPELNIDTQKLVETVKGSSLEALRPLLEKEFNASGYEADVDVPLPFLRSRLPWFSQNITVDLKPLSK